MTEKLSKQLINHGLISLLCAMTSIFSLRGLEWSLFLLFCLPTGAAVLFVRSGKSPLAEAFLISIGVASIIALIPWLFPRLGSGGALGTVPHADRIKALYIGIYLVWLIAVLPIGLFGRSLLARRRGQPMEFSSLTCYLGLFTASLFWPVTLLSLPAVIKDSGLWPIFEFT